MEGDRACFAAKTLILINCSANDVSRPALCGRPATATSGGQTELIAVLLSHNVVGIASLYQLRFATDAKSNCSFGTPSQIRISLARLEMGF